MTFSVLTKPDADLAEREAAYTAWLQKKFANNLADPSPRVSHEEAMARFAETFARAKARKAVVQK